ncbi:MAG: APC family permease [Bryobacteraceae bacterium]
MSEPLRRELSLRDLVFFNIAAVAGIRWLAAAAHTGPGSIGLWITAAVGFFVPSALVVTRLSRAMPEEGGIYVWTRSAFGEWHGFLCGWCYWLNNFFYFPSLVLAGVTMAAYIAGPEWIAEAESPGFAVPASIGVIVAVTALSLPGLGTGKWIGNAGGAATYLAGLLLIAGGGAAFWLQGSATPFDPVPEVDWQKLNFWPQIAFAFGGLELGAILGGEIRDPSRTVRRAAWISGFAISGFYVAGTLAILTLLPPERVSVVTGLAQAGRAAGIALGLPAAGPLLAALVTLGIAGQLGAWMTGTARLPVVFGMERILPPSFASTRKVLAGQSAACIALLLATQWGENFRTAYQLLVDMTVITYFIPFFYLFLTAWRHGARLSAVPGLAVTLAALAFSFVPPGGAGSVWLFEAKLAAGLVLVTAGARWLFCRGVRG